MTDAELVICLQRLNEHYRAEDIPPIRRPWLALSELSKKHGVLIAVPSPRADLIFQWFQQNTQGGSHNVQPLFKGVYFFDACFWPVVIPYFAGTVSLDSMKCLEMPEVLKSQLRANTAEFSIYAAYWLDCVDFAIGSHKRDCFSSLSPLGMAFLENGFKELQAVISQLSEPRANTRAVIAARMVIEMYLKSLLIVKAQKDENYLKRKIGHDIGKAMNECWSVAPIREFEVLRPMLSVFPDVQSRYTGKEQSLRDIWAAYQIAQAVATTVVRVLTGIDNRSRLVRE